MTDVECIFGREHIGRNNVERVLGAVKDGAKAAGRSVAMVTTPSANARIIVVWGAGHPDTRAAMDRVIASGGHVVAWDSGYWQRGSCFRCSIDAVHPQAVVMAQTMPSARFDRLGITLRDDWNPDGPIVLGGMGWKSARMYGEPVGQWERDTARAIKARFPDKTIHFRPKATTTAQNCRQLPNCVTRAGGPIDNVLRGASLVVVRHSNVAIDAIVAGVPVVAMGGAASAVCPDRLEDAGEPLGNDLRLRFLRNLAWFNWSLPEMREAATWEAIEGMMAA